MDFIIVNLNKIFYPHETALAFMVTPAGWVHLVGDMTNMIKLAEIKDSLLVVIDIQSRLAPAMADIEHCLARAAVMLQAAKILQLDTVVTEQYPHGLGHTVPELQNIIASDWPVIAKTTFSCCGEPQFMSKIKQKSYRSIAIIGIETQVCVEQTAIELLNAGYQVFILSDAITSRRSEERQLALELLRQSGAIITSVESYLFMLLRDAASPAFKPIAKLLR